jgi:type IV fimbrial biogenesis protein FimT
VLAILLKLAVPSFSSAILSNRLSSYTNNFVASTQYARSEAIKSNAPVTMCASSDGATCAASGTWAQGWIVMCNADPAAPTVCKTGGTSTIVRQTQPAVASDYHFTTASGVYAITFPASGVGATQVAVTVCRYNPPGNQERQITLTASGRTAVQTTRTGTCP